MLYRDAEEERVGEFLILMNILTREQVHRILRGKHRGGVFCSGRNQGAVGYDSNSCKGSMLLKNTGFRPPYFLGYERQYPVFRRDRSYVKTAIN